MFLKNIRITTPLSSLCTTPIPAGLVFFLLLHPHWTSQLLSAGDSLPKALYDENKPPNHTKSHLAWNWQTPSSWEPTKLPSKSLPKGRYNPSLHLWKFYHSFLYNGPHYSRRNKPPNNRTTTENRTKTGTLDVTNQRARHSTLVALLQY